MRHGRTRSKKRMPTVQMIMEYFFVQGEKERGGGLSSSFFGTSVVENDLECWKLGSDTGSTSFVSSIS